MTARKPRDTEKAVQLTNTVRRAVMKHSDDLAAGCLLHTDLLELAKVAYIEGVAVGHAAALKGKR